MTSRLRGSRLPTPPVKEALEHLASIDLLELSTEAKIERCRATRDLSCCGRPVQDVLNSCGHASLCAECSKRCDVCPVCRTSLPVNGTKLRPRLYDECITAGLISKRYVDRFQEKDDSKDYILAIHRLFSLFDVALDNNLVSLICHYVTDVCMDESAVSSDPVLSFLLDEVVVKDWCKKRFKCIIGDLHSEYKLDLKGMKSDLSSFQKLVSQLTGISNVLEIMVSSFKDNLSAELNDLHLLLNSTQKTKQHLEIMIWCIQHEFLENVQFCYPDYQSWVSQVHERKSAAINQSWPDSSCYLEYSGDRSEPALFIEQALSNLEIEECYTVKHDEIDIFCLQNTNSPVMFSSKINESCMNGSSVGYPFKNVWAAADVLFLHGASDMVVAKRAIFLYYLFDRHWTLPDGKWRYIVDDFASSFGINRLQMLESLVFYLLDDHTDNALQEACTLLPEIAGLDTHPKIAQVLLERKRPAVALSVLRCMGHDGFSGYHNFEDIERMVMSLNEALTVLRVRTDCGHLTEAFMCQRMYCYNLKESSNKHPDLSSSVTHHREILVTEMCLICMRKHLAERMIELPWDSSEEKYIHKCLLEDARQNPSSISGNLLTVFYLQRYRYNEAYQVHCELQSLEQGFLENLEGDIACQMKSISLWRSMLVEKALNLLPEVQLKQLMTYSTAETDISFSQDDQMGQEFDSLIQLRNLVEVSTSSRKSQSLVLHTNLNTFPSKKAPIETSKIKNNPVENSLNDISNGVAFQQRHLNSLGIPHNGSQDMALKELKTTPFGHSFNGFNGSHTSRFKDSVSSLKNEIHYQHLRSSRKPNYSSQITSEDSTQKVWSVAVKDSPIEPTSMKVGSRWRSDESSEDEADQIDKHLAGRTLFTLKRQTRRIRRR